MRTTPITDTLTQLTRMRFVNAYLVREDDGFTLVDTTLKGAGKDIIAAAGDVPIRRIVLTHGHGDHIGVGRRAARGARRGRRVPDRGAGRAHPRRRGEEDEGQLAEDRVAPGRFLVAGRARRQPRGPRLPGAHARSRAFFDTRDRTLIAGDAFTTMGASACRRRCCRSSRSPRPPPTTRTRPRIGQGAARAGARPAGGGPRRGRAPAARRDGSRDREGLMARAGLSAEALVDAAAALADREGLEAVTLTRLAADAGVRPPSLYAHVDGLDDLRRRLANRGRRELAAALRDAATGRAGRTRCAASPRRSATTRGATPVRTWRPSGRRIATTPRRSRRRRRPSTCSSRCSRGYGLPATMRSTRRARSGRRCTGSPCSRPAAASASSSTSTSRSTAWSRCSITDCAADSQLSHSRARHRCAP